MSKIHTAHHIEVFVRCQPANEVYILLLLLFGGEILIFPVQSVVLWVGHGVVRVALVGGILFDDDGVRRVLVEIVLVLDDTRELDLATGIAVGVWVGRLSASRMK